MSAIYYRAISAGAGRFGNWFFSLGAGIVAAGYFLLLPRRTVAGARFYRALFPDRSGLFHLMCVWRQFLSFTTVFLDRFLLEKTGRLEYESRGWSHIERALDRREGGIILMSHLGNWEVAAHLMRGRRADMPLMLYMGQKHKERIERLQKERLSESGIRIIAVGESGGSPLDLIPAIGFIRNGGFVSMTGDVIWHPSQGAARVRFLGRRAALPEAPHMLALVTGAPIFIFFAFRTGPGRYRFTASPPIHASAASRRERRAALAASAQAYADELQEALRRHPYQWYHFGGFFNVDGAGGAQIEI